MQQHHPTTSRTTITLQYQGTLHSVMKEQDSKLKLRL